MVLVVIKRKKPFEVGYTLLDKDKYESLYERGLKFYSIVKNRKNYKIRVNGNTTLHREVLDVECWLSVNHKSHNRSINTDEMLMECEVWENNRDKKFFCKSESKKNGYRFSFPRTHLSELCELSLENNGYELKKTRVCSPYFNTMEELRVEMEILEEVILGKFRYDPLRDFSETWYVYALQKMLGMPKDILEKYQCNYFRRNHKDVADYYMI